jgi:hypothetical protein
MSFLASWQNCSYTVILQNPTLQAGGVVRLAESLSEALGSIPSTKNKTKPKPPKNTMNFLLWGKISTKTGLTIAFPF